MRNPAKCLKREEEEGRVERETWERGQEGGRQRQGDRQKRRDREREKEERRGRDRGRREVKRWNSDTLRWRRQT